MTQQIDTILISHSHKDAAYVHELVDMIKVTDVEKKAVKIICSSYPGHNIPQDVNIYNYLKEVIKGNVWVIYVLSHNYYNSSACLNEMGATWVQNKEYSAFITPNFSFKQVDGAIDPSRNLYSLGDKTSLNNFKMHILKEFGLEVNDNLWESIRDSSLDKIKEIARIELEQNSFVKVQFESVRNEADQIIRIVLRAINELSYPIEINLINLLLKDENGESFLYKNETFNLLLHSGENRIVTFSTTKNDSEYSAVQHGDVTLTFKYSKYFG
ncbi:toll/interleukin-1 receptor domain-containing protein [Paenibacillus odorifer]|uniref:toll/interleukin-1 receptor domain-containing protein n=1 Tax=Paenibacillus odorifer TaxID=189426 RepID=UPI00096FEC7C|nr:toll/interleukin-1 receptor domain-containing protein [Paenibacillus odorifer]OMD18516.1 hypothetical protein BJP50_14405 [Paenibacillus odorifer]